MKLSRFGEKFTSHAGITTLMDDLGNALASDTGMIMMGGGNPGTVPAVEARFQERLQAIAADEKAFRRLVGVYDPPQGEKAFIDSLAALFNRIYGWQLSAENIALTNGSQSAFFMLFNMFAGEFEDGSRRQIQLPLAPEYIGYADAGLSEDFFTANRPTIEHLPDNQFKYHVDFSSLKVTGGTGAICVSRPTNPTGNVLTDSEIAGLDRLAREHDIPLILDGAYGTPFPHLIFTEAEPVWNDNIILCLSLSKLGLPAARTGIVIARPDIVKALSGMNAIMNLASGSLGAMLADDLVRSGEILALSRDVLCPFYRDKSQRAVSALNSQLQGLPFHIHKPEGAMFLWLWMENLPISSLELYQRLKQRGVLVVSGHYFFPGLRDGWQHQQECIRITYSQDEQQVMKGLAIIADEVRRVYNEHG